ncbi:GH25 family lysozyme [Aquamicrobium segne]|uniref:GH25 family lysozyme n=1 Tax=Aquamicrobium segne TaxID=469547 RepID=A0ABW0H2X8_9HYPH
MRRLVFLVTLTLLAACSTTLEDMAPTSSMSTISATSGKAPRFGDSKPHEWRTITPWRYPVHGTDVSKYQTSVDWDQARKAGISFAFIKATEGGDRLDSSFHEHWRNAKSAGVPRGAYHFYYFCRPATEQAHWFIRNVPKDASSLPPVLDMEWNPLSPSCKLRPPPETVRKEMSIFLKTIENHYGKKPIIYTSIDFFDDNNLSTFHGYPYWLRSVAGHPSERYGSHPFTFWQYSGTGIVPGIKGNADVNAFNGSQAAWRDWLRQNTR